MMFQMLPMMAFAAEDMPLEKGQAKIGDTVYNSVMEAVKDAPADGSTTTITLGEGNYTLYNVDGTGTNSGTTTGTTKGKNLTFVGQGTDKTTWNIGAEVPNPENYGTEYNGDYSFDGAGTVTFQNMTLRSSTKDYLGFIRADKTVVENCVINGKTFYWGYTSAEFINTTFNAPTGDYAIWTYSSPEMTFDGCTFNASGKVINVYTDAGAGSHNITVNFNNCTVNSSSLFGLYKQALNINDSNMGSYKYILNISNISDSQVTAERDNTTCTQLFGFGGKAATNNTGRTDVNIDGKCVWKDGVMQTHDYTDGAKEPNFTTDEGNWTDKGDHYERHVIKTCNYCGYKEEKDEIGYKLEYDLNGGDPAEGADDETYKEKIVPENEKVELAPAPTKEGYFFHYWDGAEGNFYGDSATIKMTANTKLTAQWGEEPPEVPDTPEGPGCCGEVTGVIIAAGTTVVGYYAGTELLRNCYGLPYWPRNRSELALMLWEDADRPMPESTLLYPDIGQEEKDMDLQHAARWAMENELIPDLNWDSRKPEEEQKFFPTYAVSRARALHAWQKAQQLKQDA
ncbi:MAG: InlB B-repeat-containing protein [Faecalibacterium sp.]|nr:InlB B-repeat-containing protein [Faecalibacterium sp.]